ncbi:DNA-3-methyladenine glycosylase family protein [Halobacteriales archaeon Cl-PHB]
MDDAAVETLRTDPVMDRLVDRHGHLDVQPAADEFERLAVSIVNQQLSTASARAVKDRLFATLDGDVTPDRVLAAEEQALLDAGLSGSKVEYLQNAATAFRDEDLTREGLADHDDAAVVDRLTEIRGVGEWTANMYLIFVLGREDVLPLGDLAVRNGIQQLYADGEELTRSEMRAVASDWRPYRSYGTRYVWLAYEAD